MGDAADSLRADVLIAGSGPIACTFARYLVDGGFNALIADSGPHYSKRRGAHLRNAVEYQSDIDRFTPVIMRLLDPYSLAPRSKNAAGLDPLFFQNEAGQVPTRSALNPRQDPCRNLTGAAASHAVGGMFIHWTNNVPRQHPSLERTKLIDHEEWEDLYSAAEKLVNMHTDIYTNSVRQTIIKRILTAHYGSQPFFHGIQDMPVAAERRRDNPEFVTFSGSDTILGPLADREDGGHLTIMPEHRVTSMKQQGWQNSLCRTLRYAIPGEKNGRGGHIHHCLRRSAYLSTALGVKHQAASVGSLFVRSYICILPDRPQRGDYQGNGRGGCSARLRSGPAQQGSDPDSDEGPTSPHLDSCFGEPALALPGAAGCNSDRRDSGRYRRQAGR